MFPISPYEKIGFVWGAKPFSFDCGPYICSDYHGAIRPYVPVSSTQSNAPLPFTLTAGGVATVNITYENKLPVEVQIYLSGDVCLIMADVRVSCDGPGYGTRLWVPANSTAHLTATVYATTGYTAGATPLAPGQYALKVANQSVVLTVS
jgi:hypothetical protein